MSSDELPVVVIAALVATGSSLLGWGSLLTARTRAKAAGVLMALAGATAVTAAAAAATDRQPWPGLGLAGVLLALSVMAYPRVRLDWPGVLAAAALVGLPAFLWSRDAVQDSSVIAVVIATIPLLHLWWRVEDSAPAERRALSWVLAAVGVVCFVGFVVGMVEAPAVVVALYLPLFILIGAAAWIGTTRPVAVDVRGVVAALLVNTLAAIAIFTTFQLAWITLDGLGAGDSSAPIAGLLAAAGAFLLDPIRRQLRLVADELLFGVRPDPLVAAGRVALGVGDDAQTALDTLRHALVLPYAELRIDGLPVTTSGVRSDHLHRLTLSTDGRKVGELLVGLRPGDLRLSPADATVLSLAGPLLAQTIRARALAEGLQQSRAATSLAREEERRRLRRDLHDGLGPRLSGIAFTADAALLATQDPEDLVVHLARVRSEAVAAIREIRELVQGLRPPALDEVGLEEAIRLQAAALRRDGGRPLKVEITSSLTPDLPAAIEVAAYRITIEALTNAARHSGADHVSASLEVLDGALNVIVRDSGAKNGRWTPGVGLTSMADRADELGGSFTAGDGEVRAILPL